MFGTVHDAVMASLSMEGAVVSKKVRPRLHVQDELSLELECQRLAAVEHS